MTQNKTYTVQFDHHVCCEICNEVYATDFDCPICSKQCASTDIDYYELRDGLKFECYNCKSLFVVKNMDDICDTIIECVKNNKE